MLYAFTCCQHTLKCSIREIHVVGRIVDKALDYRPKGSGFNPRLDHKRRST
jgi:hypothetical protein